MGLWQRIFGGKKERRDVVTEQMLLDGAEFPIEHQASPTVNLCVDRIASTISTLPLFVQLNGADAPATNRFVYLLSHRPNDYQTPAQFLRLSVYRYLFTGNCYIVVQRDPRGLPIALHVLDGVAVKVRNSQKVYIRKGKEITDQVIHIHNGMTEGVAVWEKIPDLIALENHLLAFATSYYSNGLTPTTIITLPAETGVTQAAYDQLKAAILAQYAGAKKHGKPIFRTSKDIDIETKESQNARNAMMVELMEYVRAEIARHFHIPTAMLDSAKANNSIMESETRQYYAQAILPTAELFLQGFNTYLLETYVTGLRVQADYAILLKPTPEAQARIANVYRYAGVLTVNEIRREIGYQPVDGGDEIPVPTNLLTPGATGEAYLATDKSQDTGSNNANQ